MVRSWFSEITIDLRSAALPPVSTIDVSAWFSEVTIVVPPDVHVEFDTPGIYQLWGQFRQAGGDVVTVPFTVEAS